jgi:hypothetical protein
LGKKEKTMNTIETVRVAVNEANLVRNLKFAFSNYSTFLAELIQNSRRAGATKVEITLEGKTLTVSDDGNGIENFQSLLTIGDSSWDHQTRSLENPFGMGFTSALFACNHLTVESRGQKISGATQTLLAREDMAITDSSVQTGTTLTLTDLTFDESRVEGALKEIASGYAIPILFNGVKIPRPYALNKDRFDQTPAGWVFIPNLNSVELDISGMLVYLQGILVYGAPQRNHRQPVIVHLDSTRFAAKMPDRNCLIDADEKVAEIRLVIATLVYAKLTQQQKTMNAAEFAGRYWATALRFAPDVLREHPVVPPSQFVELLDLLCYAYWFHPSDRPAGLAPVTREAFERGDVMVVRGGDSVDLESDPLSAVKLAYVKAHGGLVIAGNALPNGHWLLNAPDLEDLEIRYKIVNEGDVAGSDCLALQFSLRLCDAIEIEGPWGNVVIDETEIAIGIEGTVNDVCVYVPAKTSQLGRGVLQFESFSSDDRHDESAQEDAIRQYRRWINQARNTSPVMLLNDLLSNVRVDVTSARNARFMLEVTENGSLNVVEQLDTARD